MAVLPAESLCVQPMLYGWIQKPAEPAAAGFAGAGVQRDAIPLCLGTGAAAPCAECRGGEPLLRCPEVENLGPGKLDACVKL